MHARTAGGDPILAALAFDGAADRAEGRRAGALRLPRPRRDRARRDGAGRRGRDDRGRRRWLKLNAPLRAGPHRPCFVTLVGLWLAGLVLAPNVMMIDFALRPNLLPADIRRRAGRLLPRTTSSISPAKPVHRSIFLQDRCGRARWWTFADLPRLLSPRLLAGADRLAVGGLARRAGADRPPSGSMRWLRTLAWYILLAFRGPPERAPPPARHPRRADALVRRRRRAGGHGLCLHLVHAVSDLQRHREPGERRRSRRRGISVPRPGASTRASSSPTPRPASPRAASSPSCSPPAATWHPALSSGRRGARWVHADHLQTGSSRAATGTAARPTRWCLLVALALTAVLIMGACASRGVKPDGRGQMTDAVAAPPTPAAPTATPARPPLAIRARSTRSPKDSSSGSTFSRSFVYLFRAARW